MAIFNSYVKLPEGISNVKVRRPPCFQAASWAPFPSAVPGVLKVALWGESTGSWWHGRVPEPAPREDSPRCLGLWHQGLSENGGEQWMGIPWEYHGERCHLQNDLGLCPTLEDPKVQRKKSCSVLAREKNRSPNGEESQCIIPTRQMSWFFQLQQSVPLGGIIMPQ